MKLKRNLLAFLIMVFILSGCVSDVSIPGTLESTKQTNVAAIPNTQLVHRQTALAQVQAIAAQPNAFRKEVETYATAQKLNAKIVEKDSFSSLFETIAEKSDAKQYKPKEIATETGDIMSARVTLYGVDCYGCNVREDGTGNTATGIQMNPTAGVQQSDGSWLPGITYDGYYIIAADKSIPMYSIVEISNHGLTGKGIVADQPILAMVLDRGGGVAGNHFDLYIGSEGEIGSFSIQRTVPQAKVVRYGR